MLRRHRVVVGDVEQDQAGHGALVLAVKDRVSPDSPFRGDPEEVQERAGVVTPGAGGGPRRRGATRADIREVQLSQGVEQRRLARAGAPEERYDGVIHSQRQTLGHGIKRLVGRNRQGGRNLRGAQAQGFSNRVQPGVEMRGVEHLETSLGRGGGGDVVGMAHAVAPGRVKGLSSPERRRSAAANPGAGASEVAAPLGTVAVSASVTASTRRAPA